MFPLNKVNRQNFESKQEQKKARPVSALEERRENKDVLPEGSSGQVVDTAPKMKLKVSSERTHSGGQQCSVISPACQLRHPVTLRKSNKQKFCF